MIKIVEASNRKNNSSNNFVVRRKVDRGVNTDLTIPLEHQQPFSIQRTCACGGGCPGCEEDVPIQTKLRIGAPNDKYEQEADRVAEQVMRMPDSDQKVSFFDQANGAKIQRTCAECKEEDEEIQRKPLANILTTLIQRQIEGEEDEEEKVQAKELYGQNPYITPPSENSIQRLCPECEEELQRQPIEEEEEQPEIMTKSDAGPHAASSNLQSQLNASKGSGSPLPKDTHSFMASALGADFGTVRVHTDSKAAQMNQEIKAQAFTNGSDIYFNKEKYNPDTNSGKELLAHELTHVIQQGGGRSSSKAKKKETIESDAIDARKKKQSSLTPLMILNKSSDKKIMKKGFDSTVSICHRVLTSRKFKVDKGGVRIELKLKELDKNIPNCTDFKFYVTLTKSIGWWADKDIVTCGTTTGGNRTLSYANLDSGTYYLTIYRMFDHPYCCLEGDISVIDEPVSQGPSDCEVQEHPSLREVVHLGLDAAGMIPALGVVPDAINAGIYVIEGDWVLAGVSAAAMAPILGQGATATKWSVKLTGEAVERLGKEGIEQSFKKATKNEVAERSAKELGEAGKKKAVGESAEGSGKTSAKKKGSKKKPYLCNAKCQSNGGPSGAYYVYGTSPINCSQATLIAKAQVKPGEYPRHCSCADTKGFIGKGTQCEKHK